MAIEIKVPDMGESVIDATITAWVKQKGDPVAAGETLVELETDKVSLEVSAPRAGTLGDILHLAGETVGVGEVLATLLPVEEAVAATAPDLGGHATVEADDPGKIVESSPPATKRATPLAQRIAQDLGVDLQKVPGGDPGAKITKEDVQAFLKQSQTGSEQPSPQPAPAPSGPGAAQKPVVQEPMSRSIEVATASTGRDGREEKIHMSRRRQTIARRMVEAQQTAAMLTTFNEIDMSAVMDLRKRRREAFKERFGVDLGYMSFFIKASIAALKEFPNLNAEIRGDDIIRKYYYDIGVAIGAEEGLVVPVIRNAESLNFAGIEKSIRQFSQKVRDNTLGIEDLRGGTFTITNGGVFGSLMSTPILNPPQVAILGMHAIKERPVALSGQIVIRPMMYVALSYDHRIVDGREAVQFLVRIKELIEDPDNLLFG
jgi:2-oxoglutarate dehydrogenase E2 component (dihydrolipoamide succinyltransferase)